MDVDSAGNSRIVWQEGSSILFCVLDGSGNKIVNDVTVASGSCSNPAIAVRPDGTSHIVWEKTVVTTYCVYFNQLNPAGTKLGSDTVINNKDIIDIVPKAPGIALDSLGYSYLVWRDTWNFSNGIYYCRVNPDRTLQGPSKILALESAQFPRVSVSGPSDYLNVVLQNDKGSGLDIYYWDYQHGGVYRAVSSSAGAATQPTVAGDPNNAASTLQRGFPKCFQHPFGVG